MSTTSNMNDQVSVSSFVALITSPGIDTPLKIHVHLYYAIHNGEF